MKKANFKRVLSLVLAVILCTFAIVGCKKDSKKDDEKQLYMRIVFSESENIVWETEIKSYFHASDNERIFAIDLGKEIGGYCDSSIKMVKTEDPTLQLLFTEVMNQIVSDS